jgi:hypothetical protein
MIKEPSENNCKEKCMALVRSNSFAMGRLEKRKSRLDRAFNYLIRLKEKVPDYPYLYQKRLNTDKAKIK